MGFPYHFVDLNEEQDQRRRYLLDSYGQFAQLSVLLLPLIYQLSFGIRLLLSRTQRRAGYQQVKEHQSPRIARFNGTKTPVPKWSWQGFNWWMGDEVAQGWGARKEWAITFSWAAWLLLLIVKDTGDDYLHLTKRFGIVAASQLPIHYLLAAKAWSPIQYLTRMSHEELNPYHRLLGRTIVFFFACHASLYLNFYVQKGLLSKRIRDWDVILGITAISSALLLFTTALSTIRNYSYRVFFYLHVILSISLLPILFLHVSHLRLYILEAAAIYAVIIIQRNVSQSESSANIARIPRSNLLHITIPMTKSIRSKTYTPGQHIYLGFPSLPQKLRINPFTIANTPNTNSSNNIELVVRSLNGTTAMLNTLATNPQPIPLLIEGPYGSAKYFPRLANYDRILLVAGGIGATFTLPIFSHLQSTASEAHVRMIWTVKSLADATWALNPLSEQSQASNMDVQVLVTGGDITAPVAGRGRADAVLEAAKDGEGVELLDQRELKRRQDWIEQRVRAGRPDLRALVDEFLESDANDSVAVLVCGPKGMGALLRREVGRWIGRGRDIFWHNEDFGW